MSWTVTLNKKVIKNMEKHPTVQTVLKTLIEDLEDKGPIQYEWANYSKLGDNLYHCHLKKGRPTYVAVWQVKNKKIYLIEVVYAGTHENAPY